MSRLTALAVVCLLVFAAPALAGPNDPGGTFIDDDGSVHEGYIEAVALVGVTRGCNPPLNDRFCPDEAVTRGQMAAFLVRAMGYTDGAGDDSFGDDDQSVFEGDIDRLAASGVTRGCNPPTNDRFCPDQPVTRAEMATFLGRALGLDPLVPPPPELPQAGNPDGTAPIPTEAQAVDTSNPDHVVGDGTPASCTSAAVVAAVAEGGIVTFDCGPNPVTIEMTATARVFNDRNPDVVIDGGGLVTLSGGGDRRILYMNTCDPDLVWTTPHCDDQDHPRLVVQNLTFVDGWVAGTDSEAGGGAIYARGGRLRVVNSRFFWNRCESTGPDVGGGAIRVFDQYQDQPVYVVNSTFGGSSGTGNECSNGGALSSIGVSWTLINSLLTYNDAIGVGANPARSGTPGGGNGGGVALDGNTFTLTVLDTIISDNHANEGGGGIFFVSNDRTGTLRIEDSTMQRNPSDGFETIPGIFYLGSGPIQIVDSTVE